MGFFFKYKSAVKFWCYRTRDLRNKSCKWNYHSSNLFHWKNLKECKGFFMYSNYMLSIVLCTSMINYQNITHLYQDLYFLSTHYTRYIVSLPQYDLCQAWQHFDPWRIWLAKLEMWSIQRKARPQSQEPCRTYPCLRSLSSRIWCQSEVERVRKSGWGLQKR